jgi:hypothetical protein
VGTRHDFYNHNLGIHGTLYSKQRFFLCHRMYYSSYDRKAQKWGVGMALSNDGFKWQKKSQVIEAEGGEGSFDEFGVSRTWTVMHPAVLANYLLSSFPHFHLCHRFRMNLPLFNMCVSS